MATYKVRDRSGGTLEVHSKEQADNWVALGYVIVTDDDKPKATKSTASKTTKK
jgi:hypothetical protein